MSNSIKKSVGAILFVPFLLLILYTYFQVKMVRIQSREKLKSQYIGQQFKLNNFLDTAGNTVQPDFSAHEFTIVDFWYKACATCLQEMKQFETLLAVHNNSKVVSICIDDYDSWKKLFTNPAGAWSFLAKPVANWQQFVLKSTAGNSSSAAYTANSNMLREKLGVTSYPGIFVVDKNGTIIATPESAVEYLQNNKTGKPEFSSFLFSLTTWRSLKMWMILLGSIFIYCWLFNFITSRKK